MLNAAYLRHQIGFSKVVTKNKGHKANMRELVDLTYPYAILGIDADYLDDIQKLHCLSISKIWDVVTLNFTTGAIPEVSTKLGAYMNETD